MTSPTSIVQQASVPGTLHDHRNRIRGTEAPSPGQWVYVLPVSPAPEPDDFIPSDPLAPFFLSSWGNKILADGSYAPLRFRIHPATKIQIEGAVTGGAVGTDLFRLPAGFRPGRDERVVISSVDGTQALTLAVNASSGLVTVVAVIAGSGGTGIVFDFDNVGDWLSITTTSHGGVFNSGFNFKAVDGGISIESDTAVTSTSYVEIIAAGDFNNGVQLEASDTNNGGVDIRARDSGNGGIDLTVDGDENNGIVIEVSGNQNSGIQIDTSGGSPSDNGLTQSNLYLQAGGPFDAGLVVIQEGNGLLTTAAVGFDPEVTVPGAFGAPGQSVFEVMGGFRDSTDTWEWDGATKTYANVTGTVGPGPNIGGASPTGFSVTGGMAYDVGNAYTLVLDDRRHTWTNDGTAWVDLGIVTGTPTSTSSDVRLVYDTAGSRIIMLNLDTSSGFHFHTYEWTGSAWNDLAPATSPDSLVFQGAGIGYDEANGRVVFSTGNDTWTFYAGDWHHESPATVPDHHRWPKLTYDFTQGALLLISGGRSSANFCVFDIWSWDGTNWTEITVTYDVGPNGQSSAPLSRESAYAIWDGTQTMMFAGEAELEWYASDNDTLRDTWLYDGAGTMTFQALTPLPPGRWPGNSESMIAYDSARGKVVIYGGALDATMLLIANNEVENGYPIIHLPYGGTLQYDL